MSNVKLKEFPKQFCKVLDNHAPKIQKNIRATNANKTLINRNYA